MGINQILDHFSTLRCIKTSNFCKYLLARLINKFKHKKEKNIYIYKGRIYAPGIAIL